ncbi:hypothetical protein H2203_009064 [Taxawa tesnikishii (nom. ined.)]|nr:hypothetical protein H2203_009064 [Dothideales sp. JES 119]
MTLSSQSTCSLEDVMQTVGRERATPDLWMQIYLTRDPEKSIPLIKRAEGASYLPDSLPVAGQRWSRLTLILLFTDAGYKALVVTCDTPVLGNRLNERKTPLVLPKGLRLANINPAPADDDDDKKERKPTFNRLLMDARTAADARHIVDSAGPSMHSSSLTWEKTLPWLRKATPMKVILKGIMTPEDALLAVEHGADAIIVSNHGGRQLDDSPATIEVLQGIAEAVAGRIPVIFDGGVRRGSDVFKALALGANFVLIGRPVLWGLAYKGREGVEAVANILERELNRTMALAGVTKVKDIKKSSLAVARTDTFGLARL